ncbi:calcium-binding protein [Methylobacterium sp. CM6247]
MALINGTNKDDEIIAKNQINADYKKYYYSGPDISGRVNTKGGIFGLDGSDNIFGGNSTDYIIGGNGDDFIYGLSGDDAIVKLDIPAKFNGTVVYGLNENASINGGLYGGIGADLIDGGSGIDLLYGGNGNDTLIGGDHSDRYFSDVRSDTKKGIHKLTTNSISAGLYGEDGNDRLNGGQGSDLLDGGAGNDVLIGGADDDNTTMFFTSTKDMNGIGSSVSVYSRGGLFGGDGNDRLDGGAGRDLLYGGNGNDTLKGGSGDDKGFADKGSNSSYTFEAGLYGGEGDDRIDGGSGDDLLSGENGNDILIGGIGFDDLRGGKGADTFLFNNVADSTAKISGRDVIRDFNRTQGDKIDLRPIDSISGTSGDQLFKFIGGSNFHHVAGELNAISKSGNILISGDTNGDGTADFSITLKGSFAIQAADFFL